MSKFQLADTWLTRTARIESVPPSVLGRAFDLRAILLFSLVVALVAVLSVLLERWLGVIGALVAAGTAGLADVHAAAASIASINAAGEFDPSSAALGVLIALSSNTLSKAMFASSAGTRAFAMWVQAGLLLALAGTWLGFRISK